VGQFVGKRVYDEQGETRIRVVKGHVPAGSPGAAYEIDGISGATLTADGVTNLLRYWFGEQGFEPYLAKLRAPGA
jgi:Na+-transporting NADH:ubiquinone oxidoreductase subunit C